MSSSSSFIRPNWPAPSKICAYVSTRIGGVSSPPFDSLNLGLHVQDDPVSVNQNRHIFTAKTGMPDSIVWLNQVHGTDVVTLPSASLPESADAAFSETLNQVCAVLTADCLPVFFCNASGTQVAVAHAGWRGLCAGILESTLAKFEDNSRVMVWLGPAIGASAFEVGGEVRAAFMAVHPNAQDAFKSVPASDKWLGDLYLLAKQRLCAAGVTQIYGGDYCTFSDETRFYSYRREGKTGRMASVIWIDE